MAASESYLERLNKRALVFEAAAALITTTLFPSFEQLPTSISLKS